MGSSRVLNRVRSYASQLLSGNQTKPIRAQNDKAGVRATMGPIDAAAPVVLDAMPVHRYPPVVMPPGGSDHSHVQSQR